jgi:alpha-1,2-mannosyltransferase
LDLFRISDFGFRILEDRALRSQTTPSSFVRLTRWDKVALLCFALIIVAFAFRVEQRSAFLQRRMTDAGVYLRAAWAVRSGDDLYHIADDNDWHYNYPPLLAILLTPLADAPAGVARDGLLPYYISVALWFALNLACVLVAVHWLARTLEEFDVRRSMFSVVNQDLEHRTSNVEHRTSNIELPSPSCREWWTHRLVPLLICLPPVAHTLLRGQVNLLLLMLIAGMLRSLARGRNGQGGMWLAGAICLKIIPAFLLLFPLWRRDWRFLAGCTAGLFVGLVLIPLAALGPQRTVECYEELADGVILPGLTHNGDPTRAKELTDVTGTDSQSFVAVWHNTLYPDRATRPNHAAPWLRRAALGAGGILAFMTLWVWQRRLRRPIDTEAAETYLAWGALILVMLFSSPVSHLHYHCLCLPVVMGLLALFPPQGWLRWGWWGFSCIFLTAQTLPHIPELTPCRDFGLAMYSALLLWMLAIMTLAIKGNDAPDRRKTPDSPTLRIAAGKMATPLSTKN